MPAARGTALKFTLIAGIVLAAAGLPWAPGGHADAAPPDGLQSICGAGPGARCVLYERQHGSAVRRTALPGKLFTLADVLVVGEVHDNPLHHRIQAEIIRRMAQAHRGKTAVVMEHMRADNSAALARFQAKIDRTLPEFWKSAGQRMGDALDWKESGWPDWEHFQPIAEMALRFGAPILAGDPPRADIRAIARGGLDKLTPARRVALALDQPLPALVHDGLLAELEASHCGLMPKAAFGAMADAQRYRDAHLAKAAADAARQRGSAVLLTGNGHARTDRGAPYYLRRVSKSLRVRAILIVEAAKPIAADPLKIVPRDAAGEMPADYVIVTATQPRPDPCAGMRERFKQRSK